jgi:hypothetical protein
MLPPDEREGGRLQLESEADDLSQQSSDSTEERTSEESPRLYEPTKVSLSSEALDEARKRAMRQILSEDDSESSEAGTE